MTKIREALWRLRHWGYVHRFDEGNPNPYRCPCCQKAIVLSEEHNTHWFSLGSGYAICSTHPDSFPFPVRRWEHSGNFVETVPLSSWTPEAKSSWAANTSKSILIICGVPYPRWAMRLDRCRDHLR